MPSIDIIKRSPIVRTPRVVQAACLFDLPLAEHSSEQWQVALDLPDQWSIGVIVGPSGSGKTTIARALFGTQIDNQWYLPSDTCVLDGFPPEMGIKSILLLLSSVGFSSPHAWLRPFHVLSTGEQFRVTMARTLVEMRDLAVIDEYTSVVDRTVAQSGSAAIARTVRRLNKQFIAVTCHYDVLEWLQPDWVYEPATNTLTSGRGLQQPSISLEIARVYPQAWILFRDHHYLNTNLNVASRCFVAFWQGVPVAFCAVMTFPHPRRALTRREHQLVCLPAFQGVGIGNALSAYIGAMCRAMGWSYLSMTSPPGVIAFRARSADWRMIRRPSLINPSVTARWRSVCDRLTATFEYVGPALRATAARGLWDGMESSPEPERDYP